MFYHVGLLCESEIYGNLESRRYYSFFSLAVFNYYFSDPIGVKVVG